MNVERLRKEQGMTQNQLAEKVNVTQQAISMIENGYRIPSMKLLVKIAKVLNVSIDDLVGKESA